MALLKHIVDFADYVDWNGRHETPAGKAGLGRPRRRKAPRRLPDSPRKAKCLERKSTGMFNKVYLIRRSNSNGEDGEDHSPVCLDWSTVSRLRAPDAKRIPIRSKPISKILPSRVKYNCRISVIEANEIARIRMNALEVNLDCSNKVIMRKAKICPHFWSRKSRLSSSGNGESSSEKFG
jgi:hypothetical protein